LQRLGNTRATVTRGDLELQTENRIEELLRRPHSWARRLAGAVQTPNPVTRPLVIDLGSPAKGFLWELQWVVAQGADPATAVANVSAIGFLGSRSSAPSTIVGLGGGSDQVNAITNGVAVGGAGAGVSFPDKVICYPTEGLYFLIVGTAGNVAASAVYVVNVGVIQIPNTPEALTWL